MLPRRIGIGQDVAGQRSSLRHAVALGVVCTLAGLLTITSPSSARPDDDTAPSKKTKVARKPSNQEATALSLRLLFRYADNAQDKSELDKRVGQALDRVKNGRQIAQRIRSRFQALAEAQREKMLGQHLRLVNASRVPDAQFKGLASQLERRGSTLAARLPDQERFEPDLPGRATQVSAKSPKRDDFDPAGRDDSRSEARQVSRNRGSAAGAAKTASGSPQYRIEYKGLRCRSETDGLGSDEIYAITTAVSSSSTVTKQPTGGGYGEHEYYTEVDSGDRRRGPSQVVWSGGQETVNMTVALWEQDESDPAQVKEDVKFIFSLAEALAKALNAPGWVNLALGFADDLVIALFGLLEDDLIQQRVIEIRAAELPRYADQVDDAHQLREWNGIRYHFYTRHRGDGADYYVFYRVYRD